MFKVKYIGESTISIRNGKIYEAEEIKSKDNSEAKSFSVVDEDGESFAYSKDLFEIV